MENGWETVINKKKLKREESLRSKRQQVFRRPTFLSPPFSFFVNFCFCYGIFLITHSHSTLKAGTTLLWKSWIEKSTQRKAKAAKRTRRRRKRLVSKKRTPRKRLYSRKVGTPSTFQKRSSQQNPSESHPPNKQKSRLKKLHKRRHFVLVTCLASTNW